MEKFLGNEFLKQDGTTATFDEVVKDADLIGLYFSAHWCGPCRQFTPLLSKCYNNWKKSGEKIEIIFVSRDRDEKSQKEYFATMAWNYAYKLKDPKIQQLVKEVKLTGIPLLVIYDNKGNMLKYEADETVMDLEEKAIDEWKKLLK